MFAFFLYSTFWLIFLLFHKPFITLRVFLTYHFYEISIYFYIQNFIYLDFYIIISNTLRIISNYNNISYVMNLLSIYSSVGTHEFISISWLVLGVFKTYFEHISSILSMHLISDLAKHLKGV